MRKRDATFGMAYWEQREAKARRRIRGVASDLPRRIDVWIAAVVDRSAYRRNRR